MDPRVEQLVANLQRHWVAIAGVFVAAILGGGSGKALSPSGLYRDPIPAQLISGPPQQIAALDLQSWPDGRIPSYVIGTDLTDPPAYRAAAPLPVANASYEAIRDTIAYNDRVSADLAATSSAIPNAGDRGADALDGAGAAYRLGPAPYAREDAFDAAQAATEDDDEAYPALAPG